MENVNIGIAKRLLRKLCRGKSSATITASSRSGRYAKP